MQQVVQTIDQSSAPFSLTWFTLSESAGTGGKKMHLQRAIKRGNEKVAFKKSTVDSKGGSKNPNHGHFFTRNIVDLDTDRVVKIRPYLITKFNGRDVKP